MSEQLTRRNFLKGVAGVVGVAAVSSITGCASKETPATSAAAETTSAAATTAAETTAAAGSGKYIPGTYTGTADGIHSTITVTMTFDEENVTDVVLDVSGETPGYGQDAGDALREALLTAQSTEIDGVSGSTITSQAVIVAAGKCFAQARGEAVVDIITVDKGSADDWLGTEPNIDDASIAETWDTDILIVGAGNGGMCAAAYAAQKGLKFRVIEQNPVVQDTRHWYGAIDSSESKKAGVTVNRKKLLAEISRYASGKCDQRVVSTWINESAAMHDFVAGILESDPYNYTCVFTAGEEARWPDSPDSPDYMFPEQEHTYHGSEIPRNEVFQQYIEDLGYSIDFNTSLVKLEKDANGRVTGIIAQKSSGEFVRVNAAKGVLLACGGYPGNPYMMEALDPLGTSVTTACSFSPSDQGMGIRAAMWAGASLDKEAAPMLFDRGLVAPGVDGGYVESPSAFGGKAFPGTVKQYNPGTQPFLKVNRMGLRFTNESSPYNDTSYAAGNQPGRVYAQIHDSNYMEDIKRFHTIGCSAMARNVPGMMEGQIAQYVEEGLIFQADTLEELADKLGFDAEAKANFLATVERYNELYDNQSDDDFGKMAPRLSAIRQAPFYGCWLGASLLTTEQGIAINENTQALDEERRPIEGLYVTGDMSGSFFANNYPCLMPGIACGRTLTFAIKAVKQMGGLE
ncbi:MAG: FAD-binding protein [Hungatella sp.]|nr:FAD-binding protein [Hungatella sp.]